MALLQPKLSLKVSQRQVLTPGLMQMVSVLALNKLELKEMIDAEMVENPVLEEIDETVPMLDEVAGREERLERGCGRSRRRRRPRTPSKRSISDRTSRIIWTPAIARSRSMKTAKSPRLRTFSPSLRLLSDHLAWQLGALTLEPELREAAEFVIGNLDEDGYLAASEEELAAAFHPA